METPRAIHVLFRGAGKLKIGLQYRSNPDLAGLQVGTYAYLKNFRKGLAHQYQRCKAQMEAADESAETAESHRKRLAWIEQKQIRLDRYHEMILDRPGMWMGEEQPYGNMNPFRQLSEQEIEWNRELREEERNQQPRYPPRQEPSSSGSASAAATAPPVAATAAPPVAATAAATGPALPVKRAPAPGLAAPSQAPAWAVEPKPAPREQIKASATNPGSRGCTSSRNATDEITAYSVVEEEDRNATPRRCGKGEGEERPSVSPRAGEQHSPISEKEAGGSPADTRAGADAICNR